MDRGPEQPGPPIWRLPECAPFFRRAGPLIAALQRELQWCGDNRGQMHRLIEQACLSAGPECEP